MRHAYQLDGYNKAKKIAFEYNGQQHDMVVDHFRNDSQEKLKKRKEHDSYKQTICLERGITLLTIPWQEATTTKKLAEACLKEACRSGLALKTTSLPNVLNAIRQSN